MVGFDFFSDFSFFSYASMLWIWRHGLCYAPRLSGIGTFAVFWSLKNYYIIVTNILWHGLHEYVCYCSYDARRYIPSKCICLLPRSIWTARHAWTLALALQSIMILHQRECEPITSVHWACKHDVCSTISDLLQLSRDTGLERHKVRESFL